MLVLGNVFALLGLGSVVFIWNKSPKFSAGFNVAGWLLLAISAYIFLDEFDAEVKNSIALWVAVVTGLFYTTAKIVLSGDNALNPEWQKRMLGFSGWFVGFLFAITLCWVLAVLLLSVFVNQVALIALLSPIVYTITVFQVFANKKPLRDGAILLSALFLCYCGF